MSSKSTPNIPPSMRGHRRESAEKYQEQARRGPTAPTLGVDSQVLRAGLPRPHVETGLQSTSDLARIEQRAE